MGPNCKVHCAVQAQVASQLILVGLLLQYLLAPKIAETMRQRAIMLCRALTTTESQALKKEMASPSQSLSGQTSPQRTWPIPPVLCTHSSLVFLSKRQLSLAEQLTVSRQRLCQREAGRNVERLVFNRDPRNHSITAGTKLNLTSTLILWTLKSLPLRLKICASHA